MHLRRVMLRHQGRFEDELDAVDEEEAWLRQRMPQRVNALLTCRMNRCATLNALGRYEQVVSLAPDIMANPGLPADSGFEVELITALVGLGRIDDALAEARAMRCHWSSTQVFDCVALPLALLAAARGRYAAAMRIHCAWRTLQAAQQAPTSPADHLISLRIDEQCRKAGSAQAGLEHRSDAAADLDGASLLALAIAD